MRYARIRASSTYRSWQSWKLIEHESKWANTRFYGGEWKRLHEHACSTFDSQKKQLICHCPRRSVMQPINRHRPGLDPEEDNKRTYPFDVCQRVDEVIEISCPQKGLPPPMVPSNPISESKWWILDQTLGKKLWTVTWNLILKWQWTKKRVLPKQVENISAQDRAGLK